MCRVWCECGPDSDKHGWVSGPITKTISTQSSTRWAMLLIVLPLIDGCSDYIKGTALCLLSVFKP